jgi:hypothetical protein
MASPGQILNIGTQPGQNHFNIGIGYPSGHVDHSPQEIEAGFSSNPEFIGVDADAWCRFRVEMDGGTTSSGTKYPRSELREFAENSTDHAAFDGNTGTHYMQGISRFVHLPPNKPWAVMCQIHDASSDLIRVQSEGTSTSSLKLVARHTPPGGSETATTVKASISLMEEISWKLEIVDGTGTLYINGSSVLTFGAGATGLYMKAGCYAQSNDTIDAATEYAAVDIKAGSLETWHTGYAAPSTGGGTGGGGGTTTPVVFKMGFGSCIDAADSDALAVCASMDPDYFLQCGDVYYADGESGYASHWDAKFQAPHYATLLNTLEAKGPLVERHIYIWSDHDAFANDAYGPAFDDANVAYRSYPLWSGLTLPSDGIYRSFEIGRVLFIAMDERTFKDVQTKTDDENKTVLGAAQKAWFQNLIAQSNHALIVIMGDIPITTPTQAGDDSWAGYNTERLWMQSVLDSSSAKFIRLSGNQHCLARTANTYGYDRAWQAAPLNKATKVSAGGDGMDESYPTNANEGTVKQLFGFVTFTDDGNQITVDFKGYEATSPTASTQRISDSIIVSAPGGLPGGGGGTPGGGGTGGGSGPTIKVGQVATHPTGGPVTPPFPTETVTGEYVLIEVHSRYGHDVTCDNPDWQRWAYKRGTDSALYAGSISVYGKLLADGDTPPTFSTDASNGGLLAIASSWGSYSPVASAVDSDPAVPVVAPSALVPNPNSIAAYFVAQDNDFNLTSPSNGTGLYALTAISGPDSGDGMAVAAAYRLVTTVGSTGTCQWTSTGTGNPTRWTGATLVMAQVAEPPPPPPEAHVLYGIDVSEQQAGLDLVEAKTEGVSFVLAKLGQGAGLEVFPDKTRLQFPSSIDSAFSQFVTDAAANALPLGAVWLAGNSEPPEAQAARAAAAIGDITIPVIMHWQQGSGDYAQLEAVVLAFRAAGMSVRMIYFDSDYWRAQRLPTLGPLNLAGAVNDRVRNHDAGTLQVLLGPYTLNPLDAWDSYGFVTTKILRYANTAKVAGVPRVSALAFQTEDTDALAALLAHATGPDVVNPPVPPPGPEPGGLPQPSDEPPQLIDVQYEFHFEDLRTGLPFGSLPLRQVRLSTVLGGESGTLSALIPVSDPDVRALNPWAVAVPRRTALYVRRIEVYPPGTIANREKVIWGGIVWDLDPHAGEGVLELKAATFESYLARRYIDEDRVYSQAEQTAIHANIIGYFEVSKEGGDIGIATAPIHTGQKRDRHYLAKDNHQILQVLQQLSRVENGFDWYIEPFREEVTGLYRRRVLYGYPRLGRTAAGPTGPLRLRHYTDGSPTNIVAPPKVKRQGTVVDNEMIGIGKSVGEEQLRVTVTAAELGRPEIQSGFPLLQGVHSDTSVSVPETLKENAGAALRKGWVSEIILTEVTLQGTTSPTLHDVNLGDDVLVDTDDATWPAPVTLAGRIYAISVALAEGESSEQVTLTLAGEGLTV